MPPRPTRLPGDVELLLTAGRGVLTVTGAAGAGVPPHRLLRLVRAGLLVRLARGAYASAEMYHALPPWPAFALRSRAFTLAVGGLAHAAGWSAVALRGWPTITAPPRTPTVVVPIGYGTATNSAFGQVRVAALPVGHRDVVDGVPVLSPARATVDLARTTSRAEALVLADAALALGNNPADLAGVLELMPHWPGVAGARWVIEHADPYAESALETLGRLTFIDADLPVPVSNPWIDLGDARYRADHLLDDQWLIFEGDGALKYSGPDAATVVDRQREREWRLRQAGFEICRYGWRLARHDRAELAGRFRHAIASQPVQRHPFPWYRDVHTYRRAA
ncbi:type IV toxin-antitoxin system AbiEi family antitoxin domain-containing protein [Phytoactinopolyspora limicola]|uniref:type IV toxin-antitoxin system AbiEi family antitoxin domain-containing protein n=1 Tax=Phytoactinopolyspora limicola TaxID=2715536 RepID=UPI00140E82D1|nr:type IV toxin-antitoxin system AbiEi family antitoxin domain-containing protein [Phytoactinopolyspora limicola]